MTANNCFSARVPGLAGTALLCWLSLACGSSRDDVPATLPGAGAAGGKVGNASGSSGKATGGRSELGSGGIGGTSGAVGTAGSTVLPEPGAVVLDGTPLYTRVPRLTVSQWERAVTDILRFPEARNLSQGFARPVRGSADFDNNEKLLHIDQSNFADFETGAEAAAALATGSDTALAALYDGSDADGFVRTLGRRAFRRPLTEAEETAYGAIFARGEELYGAGFANGAALVIRAMLASPHFLYRTELGPAGEALNGYEIASKLSFWLLDTTPSDELLDAAGAGQLDSDEGLEAAVREMLETPAAVAVLGDFHRQLLQLDRLASLDKSGVPDFDPALVPELEAVSKAFFDMIVEAGFGLRQILTSSQAYVGAGLAPFYAVTPPASGLELRQLGPARSGYFLQVPFLMLWADGDRSDPINRGLQLQRMLCGPLPASSETTPPQPVEREGRTTREYVTELTAGCGSSCHAVFDPLGFALENFDGLGRQREQDNGKPVNTASSYPFDQGVREFNDGEGLVNIMADRMQVHACYSKNVSGYALGRDMAADDRPLLERLARVSLSQSVKELVLALLRDPAFRSRPEVAP